MGLWGSDRGFGGFPRGILDKWGGADRSFRGVLWGFLKELKQLVLNRHKIWRFGHKSIKNLGIVQVFSGFMG